MTNEFKAKSETLGPQIYILRFSFKWTGVEDNERSAGLKAESLVCGSHDLATPTACQNRIKTLD